MLATKTKKYQVLCESFFFPLRLLLKNRLTSLQIAQECSLSEGWPEKASELTKRECLKQSFAHGHNLYT
jgi:hypothetical protein